MEEQRLTYVFDNALGEAEEQERFDNTRCAFAVVDATGEALAVAAVWDYGWGREEIGVDVRRDARGHGLAKAVVGAATHAILAAGRVPYYSCGGTNVRSHNNAIACGFRPVYTRAFVTAGQG
jgi:RimJ/RimL family protein N-acetyltransferase